MALGVLGTLARRSLLTRQRTSGGCRALLGRLVSSSPVDVGGGSDNRQKPSKEDERATLAAPSSEVRIPPPPSPPLQLHSDQGHQYVTSSDSHASSESGSDGQERENSEKTTEENEILEAALAFVHKYGWSQASITAGAESCGYPGIVHGMFPKGGFELVHYFYQKSNKQLIEHLVAQSEAANADPTLKKSESEIMTEAIEMRLKMLEPYINEWPQALALMALPPNVPTSLANLLTLIDDIAYYAGDRSIDIKWYGKRLLLAGVYKATELYMVQDRSEGKVETWRFLRRRMQELSQLYNYVVQTGQASQFATEFATTAFITARNILGMNWKRYS